MIALEDVSVRFGGHLAVDRVSLRIELGEFFVLIGSSGSGKSTTLKAINRLVPHTGGRIAIDGEDVTQIPEDALRRRMGYAIQSVGLFPHWTVARNVAAVPRLLGWPRARIEARVDELLTLLRLDPAEARTRYPHQLSGGQQQRVGVARALATDPDVLLMDEPFGALDPITRQALQREIAAIHHATGKTIVFVTHDMQEALLLADRIAILDRGRLVQVGTPRALLSDPADDFVRAFVGQDERGLRLLSVLTAAERMRPADTGDIAGEAIAPTLDLRSALSLMAERRTDRLLVRDANGAVAGVLHAADLLR